MRSFAAASAFVILWSDLAYSIDNDHPLKISKPTSQSIESLDGVVVQIIEQFQFLMEKRDLWKVMQLVPSRQLEKVAQTLFFATAFAYCVSNNLDITPEADTGTGPVDFKFSSGLTERIVVELKLSKNSVVKGYATQLKTYVAAEMAKKSHYIVIDLGRLGKKWEELKKLNDKDLASGYQCQIWLVDGTAKASASKRAV